MTNRKAEVLSKYLTNLTQLGFNKEDKRVINVLNEIEKELELNDKFLPVKNQNKALVIAIKDDTGSIGVWENNCFNEYYQLAIDEINHKYNDVKEIFITHNTEANTVNKDEFFKLSSTGGTITSSALKKLIEYLDTDREVIVIQFSDGDNLTVDCKKVIELMNNGILPNVKYFKYFEANQYNRHSTLRTQAYDHINSSNLSILVAKDKDESLKGMRFSQELDELE